jgi:nucleoside-diphosphate-sugar epimerase
MSSRVLLTGATGFVGGALLARLATAGLSVTALVRGRSDDHARERALHSLSRFLPQRQLLLVASRVKVVAGDLTSSEAYARTELEHVTHVVHSAACTSFASNREVWRSNVEGTERLAEQLIGLPRLQRFLYVSTAYCCGDRPSARVLESDGPRAEHGHVNEYTRSKAEAELRLRAMGWGRRLIVARPSIVVGHTQLGVGPSSSLFWYYRAVSALCCGPFSLDDRRDVVPVDYVADALQFLLTFERPRFDTYHLSAGAVGSDTVADVLRALSLASTTDRNSVPGCRTSRQSDYRGQNGPCRGFPRPSHLRGSEIQNAHAGRGTSPESDARVWRKLSPVTLAELGPQLRALVRDETEARKLARGMRACAKLGALDIQFFDNGRLLSEGFRPPPRFVDYAGLCLQTSGEATIFDQMIDDA